MSTRLFMLVIHVKDIKSMVAFYRDVLGFETDWDGKGSWAEFRNRGIFFAMYDRAALEEHFATLTWPSGPNGTFSLAIDLPRFREVDALFERAVAGGATPIGLPEGPKEYGLAMRAAWIADPEGNLIEICSWNGKYDEEGNLR